MTLPQSSPTHDLPNFQAPRSGERKPDTNIAVGPSHILLVTNSKIYIYDKQGNLLSGPLAIGNFFLAGHGNVLNQVETDDPLHFVYFVDPRALFDPYRMRYWIAIICGNLDRAHACDRDKRHDKIAVAVSQSEDPIADGWYFYSWDAAADYKKYGPGSVWESGDGPDWLSIGIDKYLFHTTVKIKKWTYEYDSINAKDSCNFKQAKYYRVLSCWADDIANNNPAVGVYDFKNTLITPDHIAFPDLNLPLPSIAPVSHHGQEDYGHFVGAWYQSPGTRNHKIIVWQLKYSSDGIITYNSIGTAVELPPPYNKLIYNIPNAPQKGSNKLIMTHNVGHFPYAVSRHGKLYLTFVNARNWGGGSIYSTSIHLVRMDISNFPNISNNKQDGFINRIFGANNAGANQAEKGELFYYAWPSIEVNKAGKMAIVYTRSGGSIWPEVRYSEYRESETDIRPSRLVKDGEAPFDLQGEDPLSWGDHSAISLDPDDNTIWIANQYASLEAPTIITRNFRIWISRVFA